MDLVDLVVQVNAGRDPHLMRRKFDAMASGPFAFLRASAAVGHASLDLGSLPPSPVGWVTGDLHVENFGTFKGANRLVFFDLNDFDEAARLPVGVDIVRLLASVVAAGREYGLGSKARREAVHVTLTRMAAALACGKAFWLDRDDPISRHGFPRSDVSLSRPAGTRHGPVIRKATGNDGDVGSFRLARVFRSSANPRLVNRPAAASGRVGASDASGFYVSRDGSMPMAGL